MKKRTLPWPASWTKRWKIAKDVTFSLRDFVVSLVAFLAASVLCLLLRGMDPNNDTSYVAVIFLLEVFLTAFLTDGYLVKPFGTSELLARIRTAIRHTRTTLPGGQIAQTGKLTVGELTIDYDKHQVLMRGENAKLTVNEYKIVSLLGKYAGKVLTYDFIIRELWGPKARTDNQILRVNMANIRRKIEKNPGQPEYIFTEAGVGYRMREGD